MSVDIVGAAVTSLLGCAVGNRSTIAVGLVVGAEEGIAVAAIVGDGTTAVGFRVRKGVG